MPTYRVNADFLVCMSVEVEADSPEQAAAEFNDFPSIPCGVDYDLGDTAPRYIAVCDAETGDTLHEEDYR